MGGKVTLHETITDGITVTNEKQPSHQYSERARRHLWLQMSRMGAYDEHNEVPIMVRGEGTRVYDANGTEYFDGLAGLFTNALGHGRRDPLVPFSMFERLTLATKSPTTTLVIDEAGHNDFFDFGGQRIDDAITVFVKEHFPQAP